MEKQGVNKFTLGAIVFMFLFLAVLISARVAHWWVFGDIGSRPAPSKGISTRDADDLVAKFRTTGLLIRDDGPRYWVSAPHWAYMNAQQKEQFAVLLDSWRRHHGPAMAVEIYDAQSGRRLATYDSWHGFSVE